MNRRSVSAASRRPTPGQLILPTATALYVSGNSLSAGAGASSVAKRWYSVGMNEVALQLGITVPTIVAKGIGGSRMSTHAIISGTTNPMTWLPSGGSIPASGPVTLIPTESEVDLGESPTGLTLPGFVFASIPGTITRPGGAHSDPIVFTRTTSGTALPVSTPTELVYTDAVTNRQSAWAYWGLENNRLPSMPPGTESYALGEQYPYDTLAEMSSYRQGHWLTFGLSGGPAFRKGSVEYNKLFGVNGDGGVNSQIRVQAGEKHYCDSLSGMLNTSSTDPEVSAYAYSSISPTATDITDAADGVPGPSLRQLTGGDVGHLNDAGQAWAGHRFALKVLEQKWFG